MIISSIIIGCSSRLMRMRRTDGSSSMLLLLFNVFGNGHCCFEIVNKLKEGVRVRVRVRGGCSLMGSVDDDLGESQKNILCYVPVVREREKGLA